MKLNQVPLSQLNAIFKNTMMELLDIKVIELGEDYIKASMPVTPKVHQPMGLLHGGASAVLIESIGSVGSVLLIDTDNFAPVGIEINANHISGVSSGVVIATGKLVHGGRRTHLWQVDLHHEETKKHICTGRLTVMIVPKKNG
ncbi:MAG: 1,4-dihydroxy-2-naphthoyl-CoA hydrolase [Psychromonas sp.]|jgi:1,4-dihydroxy-2-naphthoyl-CoA hydrolase